MNARKTYPLHLKIWGDVADGLIRSTKGEAYLLDSFGAIEIEIRIKSGDYPKGELYEAVKETAMKAAEYFH